MSLYVDIKKKYKDFTLEVAFSNENGTLGLLGASGSGKSMTLKCIAGLLSPDEGVIRNGNRVLFDSSAKIDLKPQKRNVGYLFQNYAIFPNMTVRKNIEIAYRGEPDRKEKVIDEMLERYSLTELQNRYPVNISGGQQQRTALARIFAYEPELLLLDEPFSALDTFLRENMQAELKRIIKTYEGDVVMVTHSRDEAYKICDNLVILESGVPVADGETNAVFDDPVTIRAARITGCKNTSAITKTGKTTFIADDWGVELDAGIEVLSEHKHVGIRAHDFVPHDSMPSGAESINLIKIIKDDEIKGLFEKTIVFHADVESVESKDIKTGPIWWTCSSEMDSNDVAYLAIKPEDILLLKD